MNKRATKFLTVSSVSSDSIGTPQIYALSPSKSIKGSNYREFLKDKNVLLCTRLYKYAPNLESLLTQQYTCIMQFMGSYHIPFDNSNWISNTNSDIIHFHSKRLNTIQSSR
jgi:hypothetical protein